MSQSDQTEPDSGGMVYKLSKSPLFTAKSFIVYAVEGNIDHYRKSKTSDPYKSDANYRVFSSLELVGAYLCHMRYLVELEELLKYIPEKKTGNLDKLLTNVADMNRSFKNGRVVTEDVRRAIQEATKEFAIPDSATDDEIADITRKGLEAYENLMSDGKALHFCRKVAKKYNKEFPTFRKFHIVSEAGGLEPDEPVSSDTIIIKASHFPDSTVTVETSKEASAEKEVSLKEIYLVSAAALAEKKWEFRTIKFTFTDVVNDGGHQEDARFVEKDGVYHILQQEDAIEEPEVKALVISDPDAWYEFRTLDDLSQFISEQSVKVTQEAIDFSRASQAIISQLKDSEEQLPSALSPVTKKLT